MFQHTAARRRLETEDAGAFQEAFVSTHSRPKAAGRHRLPRPQKRRFNTQPPEGGCRAALKQGYKNTVSTHSRPKAAAKRRMFGVRLGSFNTQPPEGGCCLDVAEQLGFKLFQHTAARRRLVSSCIYYGIRTLFQHTAARRRLAYEKGGQSKKEAVSTHSRPKAAASAPGFPSAPGFVSTHSRPKAAEASGAISHKRVGFQHTAARRRLLS